MDALGSGGSWDGRREERLFDAVVPLLISKAGAGIWRGQCVGSLPGFLGEWPRSSKAKHHGASSKPFAPTLVFCRCKHPHD